MFSLLCPPAPPTHPPPPHTHRPPQFWAAAVERERAIFADQARQSGKPEAIVEKMVEGSVQKFLKEVTLLGQPFVKNDKQSVGQLLKSKGASVASFTLYVVGEGLERRNDDFAAEVMAQVASQR